jgi:hypothetical protein
MSGSALMHIVVQIEKAYFMHVAPAGELSPNARKSLRMRQQRRLALAACRMDSHFEMCVRGIAGADYSPHGAPFTSAANAAKLSVHIMSVPANWTPVSAPSRPDVDLTST